MSRVEDMTVNELREAEKIATERIENFAHEENVARMNRLTNESWRCRIRDQLQRKGQRHG